MGCGKTNIKQTSIHPQNKTHATSEQAKVVPKQDHIFLEEQLKGEQKIIDSKIAVTPQQMVSANQPIQFKEKPNEMEKEKASIKNANNLPIIEIKEKPKATLINNQEKQMFNDAEFPPTNASLGTQITKEYQWKRCNDIIPDNCTVLGQISSDDIKQGELGDCYFMCALAGIAPYADLIKSFFVSTDYNPLGKYSIKMYLNGVETVVTIDDYFPCLPNTNMPAFAKSIKNQLWVMLLEKAWAKANVTYSDIINNNPGYPIKVLTGAPSSDFLHKELKTSDELWQSIINGIASKKLVLSSVENASITTGLVNNHNYTVLMAKEVISNGAKIRLLKLRNPWGGFEWKGKWSDNDTSNWTNSVKTQMGYVNTDDGTFHMSFEDFINFYSNTTICNIHPSYTPKSLTLGHIIGNYSACSITFSSEETGYIYASYLDYKLRGSGATQFEHFYVNAGLWIKLENGKYKLISKVTTMKAPYIYLLKNECISKGEYIVVLECLCNQENINKVVLTSYSSARPQMKEISLNDDTIKKLMIAASVKCQQSPFDEDSNFYFLLNFMEGGVSFCSYTLCNHTDDKTVTQVVRLSDRTIRCLAPYDSKVGEFEITAPPNHEAVAIFRAKIENDNVAPTISINFSCNITNSGVDPITLISQSNMKTQYEMNGAKVPAYLYMLSSENNMYMVYMNDSDNVMVDVQTLKLDLTNLATKEGVNEYAFKLLPHQYRSIKMSAVTTDKVSVSHSEKVVILPNS